MKPTDPPRPVVLCILDGWGEIPNGASNSIRRARVPNWARLTKQCPFGTIEASAEDVGLPEGQMGNSEVGHMNLGAGRLVMQDLVRIEKAIKDGQIGQLPGFRHFVAALRDNGGTAHLIGLLSPGGVHAHQEHIVALARLFDAAKIPAVIHALLDGRDTPPQSALDYVRWTENELRDCRNVRIGTVIGRFFAMDRDNRWDRVERAYDAIARADGKTASSAEAAIEQAYAVGETDEFVSPTVIGGFHGMRDGDGIVMANFRADRAREILTALLDPDFDRFPRAAPPRFGAALGMASYSASLDARLDVLFPPEDLSDTFGEVVARAGLHQLRIAETEKYAHVTFFFNGGREAPFPNEQRILVPSPKVKTYDLQPEMSALQVTDDIERAIADGAFDVIIVNYANPDMVGHTGIMAASIAAVETIDACIGRLAAAVEGAGGTLLVTADHGNVEQMVDPETGAPHTAHTTNPVPVLLINAPDWVGAIGHGRLADIAPTLLQLLGLPQPAAMTGRSLLVARDRHELRATA